MKLPTKLIGAARHHFALALLRQQGLPGDGRAGTIQRQRSAAGDYESEPAAWSGDDRLSSTKVVLDFMARKIGPFQWRIELRRRARRREGFRAAMQKGRHGERYLLGAVNWTFVKFFDRLERLTKVASPRLAFPSNLPSPARTSSIRSSVNGTSPLRYKPTKSKWPNTSGTSIQIKRSANWDSSRAIRRYAERHRAVLCGRIFSAGSDS
jgi:hypothetical protein